MVVAVQGTLGLLCTLLLSQHTAGLCRLWFCGAPPLLCALHLLQAPALLIQMQVATWAVATCDEICDVRGALPLLRALRLLQVPAPLVVLGGGGFGVVAWATNMK